MADTFKNRTGADMSEAELAQRVQAGSGNVTHGVRQVQAKGRDVMTTVELEFAAHLVSFNGLALEMGSICAASLWLAMELLGGMEGRSVSDTLPAISAYTATATQAIDSEYALLKGKVKHKSAEGMDDAHWAQLKRESAGAIEYRLVSSQ